MSFCTLMQREESAFKAIKLRVSKLEVKHSNHALGASLRSYKDFMSSHTCWGFEGSMNPYGCWL